jgi:tetratricopeptide (TPR) repeat protein
MTEPRKENRWREAARRFVATYGLLLAIVVIGGGLRIAFNDVVEYSPADEAHYVSSTRFLAREGFSAYPRLVRSHLDRPELWLSPPPLRWGYLAMTTLTCAARGLCDGRALAWLSTIAGVASIVFTYLLGARLVGRRPALLAAALTVSSPLQLAFGRRALQDEVYCAVFLAAFWALVRLLQEDSAAARERWRSIAAFVATGALAFAVKETFALPYAGLAAVYLLAPRERRLRVSDALVLAAPPALFFAGFALIGRDVPAFFELLRLGRASFLSDYSAQYEAGPPHRVLFDLFVLAPITCILAAVAIGRIAEGRRDAGGERWLALFLAIGLAAFMGLPKNVRFVVILDPILRLLAAWALTAQPWVGRAFGPRFGAIVVLGNAAAELALFHAAFVAGGIYDPTTHDVLYALGALPRASAQAQPNTWPIVFFAILTAVVVLHLATRRGALMEPKEAESKEPEAKATSSTSQRWNPIALGAAAIALAAAAYVWSSSSPRGPETTKSGAPMPSAEGFGPTNPTAGAKAPRDAMALGLEALYTKRDPVAAAGFFREVLASNPEHYGATFQLATALDRAGDLRGARPIWAKMLVMAEAQKDTTSIEAARARIAAIDEILLKQPAGDPAAAAMSLGLDALYEKRDPAAAVEQFRKVLALNPEHYGATFQLATALDQAGKPNEARPVWTKVLAMAEAIKDAKTAELARGRIGKR